jgi:hypothetical protein
MSTRNTGLAISQHKPNEAFIRSLDGQGVNEEQTRPMARLGYEDRRPDIGSPVPHERRASFELPSGARRRTSRSGRSRRNRRI